MNAEETVVLRTFRGPTEADLAASRLRAAAIDCQISTDDAGGMLPGTDLCTGVRLLVARKDEARARMVLEDLSSVPGAHTVNGESAPKSTPSLSALFLGIVLGAAGYFLYQQIDRLRTKTYEYDNDRDGRVDEVYEYRRGLLTAIRRDRNYDGRMDEWVHYTENLLWETTSDDDFDQKVDGWLSYSNGIIVRGRCDTDHNGQPDVTISYENGVASRADWTPNEKSTPICIWLYRAGWVEREFIDENDDGIFDVVVKYDPFSQPAETNRAQLAPGDVR